MDPVQMEQVILNLAINAKEAMSNGGKLTISTYVHSQHVGNRLDYFASLSITDTGAGMTEEVRSHIFEPFFTTKPKGTGLGLATVYGIVSQSSGEIEVNSHPGEGTEFIIKFPLKLNAIDEKSRPIIQRTEWKGTETILLIEDEDAVRKVISQILLNEGYTVWLAENGESAILNYSHLVNKIDLVISDVVMPVMGGIEVVSKFRQLKSDLNYLYISGYTGEEHEIAEKSKFLEKPIDRVSILQKIRNILDKSV
jgi:CheY-like chemotaxis protein